MYELRIKGQVDKKLIKQMQDEYYEQVEGTYELYDSLYMNNYCRSYNKDRIFFIGYVLANNNIDFTFTELEG
mgnify:FL=1